MTQLNIQANIHSIQQKICILAQQYNRDSSSIQLLAVTKGQPFTKIIEAYHAGLSQFAESYIQEALPKIEALHDLQLLWHFIGHIQSNKTESIAQHFTWVHSVDRLKIAQQLDRYRLPSMPLLNICIQVNLEDESTKSGIQTHTLLDLVQEIIKLPHLCLRGLMCIPTITSDEQQQYQTFRQLNDLLVKINRQFNLKLDTLSMGMSEDYAAAIHAGSTILRIGRGIFGPRTIIG